MDNKGNTRSLLVAMLVFLGWLMIANVFWPAKPPPPSTQPTGQTTEGVAGQDQPSTTRPASGPTEAATGAAFSVRGGTSAVPVVLGSADAGPSNPFRMAVTVEPRGAAVSDVRLNGHYETVRKEEPYQIVRPVEPPGGRMVHSFSTEQIHLEPGGDFDLGAAVWNIVEQNQERVVLSVDIVSGAGEAVARLVKTYELPRLPANSLRNDLKVELQVDNLTAAPLTAIVTQRGPVGMRRVDARLDDRAVYVGRESGGIIEVERHGIEEAGAGRALVTGDDPARPVWVAFSDKYFTVIMTPVGSNGALDSGAVREVKLVKLSSDSSFHDDASFRMVSPPLTIAPGQAHVQRLENYLGPKSKVAFVREVPEYARRNYYAQVTASYNQGCCAFLTFDWLIDLMIGMLNWFHRWFGNYGIAIMILVLIVRTLLHPLTKKVQVNMVRMQKQMAFLAPKLAEVKKRYENDRAKLQQETMKVYADAGINPAGQLLNMVPMFLQMPIWIALYTSLNINGDMRHHPFALWIRDLTAPDAIVQFASSFNIPLLGSIIGPISSLNILPFLLSAAFVLQQKLMPKPPKPEGEPTPAQIQAEQMQKMMPIMSVLFGLFLYNAPSGLTVYILTSTIIGTIEQARIRAHIKRDEAAGKLDFKPAAPEARKRKPGQLSFFEKLQKAAEEAQRQRGKR